MIKGEFGVLILAGGKSERMNYPKAFLLVEGKTFLKKIVDEYYNAGVKNICVVLNSDFCNAEWEKYVEPVKLRATIIKNSESELGRFHSLKLGIKKMLNLDFCFIQNIDNPLVSKDVIKSLIGSSNSDGYSSPKFLKKNGHPVLISKKIIYYLDNLPDGNFNLRTILSEFIKQEVEVKSNTILLNINTIDDYKSIQNTNCC